MSELSRISRALDLRLVGEMMIHLRTKSRRDEALDGTSDPVERLDTMEDVDELASRGPHIIRHVGDATLRVESNTPEQGSPNTEI